MQELIRAIAAALTAALLALTGTPGPAAHHPPAATKTTDDRCATQPYNPQLTDVEDHTTPGEWPVRCAMNFLNRYTATHAQYLDQTVPPAPGGFTPHCIPLEPCVQVFEQALPGNVDSVVCGPRVVCQIGSEVIGGGGDAATIFVNSDRAAQSYEVRLRIIEHALALWRGAQLSTACDLMYRTVTCQRQLVAFTFGPAARTALADDGGRA